MSEAYAAYPNTQTYNMPNEKPRGHVRAFLDHGAHHGKKFFNFVASCAIATVVFGSLGAYAWNEYYVIPNQKQTISSYQKEINRRSFNIFLEELKRIDPNEYKNLVTDFSICTDEVINSNAEADMLGVCMSEYYRRKARVKVARVGD